MSSFEVTQLATQFKQAAKKAIKTSVKYGTIAGAMVFMAEYNPSDRVKTRVSQIASLSQSDGGGSNKARIDSNEECCLLANLLANCSTAADKEFVKNKIQEYINSSQRKEHFESTDGKSWDQIIDSKKSIMNAYYDAKGKLIQIDRRQHNSHYGNYYNIQ